MGKVTTKNIAIGKLQSNKGQIEGLPGNPRLIKDQKFDKLVKSIEENPEMLQMRELLVYPHGDAFVVIGGNMRLEAMKKLGYKECPCKVIPADATVEQLKAYTIKDNNGFGEWDFDMLANEWDVEQLEDWGLDLPVWEEEKTDNTEKDDVELQEYTKIEVDCANEAEQQSLYNELIQRGFICRVLTF